MFRMAYYLLLDTGAEAATSPRAWAIGEQGEYYDPLFTYKEGGKAGYFVASEESGGHEADVGPSGAGASKGSPVASSSFGWSTEDSASESGSAIRVDSAKNFPIEPIESDAAAKTFEATSPFGIVPTSWLLLPVVSCLNTVLLQVFSLRVHQLQGNQTIFPRDQGVT